MLGRRLALATIAGGAIFLLLPAKLGFERPASVPGYDGAFGFIYFLDLPHNLLPSLHVAWSALILHAVWRPSPPWARRLFEIWFVLMSASVVLVHQHHVLDVAAGLLLAYVSAAAVRDAASQTDIDREPDMKRMIAVIAFGLLSGGAATAGEEDPNKKDHDELRVLLKIFTDAFNSGNVEPLVPHLHKDFSVTMINQDLVTNRETLNDYLKKRLTAPQSPLKDVKIAPEADISTVFFNGRFGVNRGSSTDTYTLKDGRVFTLKTRWTGTAIQEDGKWKVLNAHIGLNPIENPIIDGVEKLSTCGAPPGSASASRRRLGDEPAPKSRLSSSMRSSASSTRRGRRSSV